MNWKANPFKVFQTNLYKSLCNQFSCIGEPVIILLSLGITDNPVTISGLNVITDDGTHVQPINDIVNVSQSSYAGVFTPPADAFYFQVIGIDSRGYFFSHFTDTAMQVSSVNLILGKLF